jgi:hypothetical protein
MKKLALLVIIGFSLVLLSCKEKDGNQEKGDHSLYSRRIVNLNDLGKYFITSLDQKVFQAIMDGKIKAYEVDTLSPHSLIAPTAIKEKIDHKENTTIAPRLDTPDYTVDTVIVTPFKVTEIKGHCISEKWFVNTKGSKFGGELHAFGLTWKPVFANIELPEQPICWVSFNDLGKILSSDEMKTLKKALYDQMTKRLSDY